MEFAEGYGTDQRDACELFLSRFRVLWPTAETAWLAAGISRTLRERGEPFGDHDAWIAGLALQHAQVLICRNNRHVRRVPDLAVRVY